MHRCLCTSNSYCNVDADAISTEEKRYESRFLVLLNRADEAAAFAIGIFSLGSMALLVSTARVVSLIVYDKHQGPPGYLKRLSLWA
jgi:hypothetical protein